MAEQAGTTIDLGTRVADGRVLTDHEVMLYAALAPKGEPYPTVAVYRLLGAVEQKDRRAVRAMLWRAEHRYGLLESVRFPGRRAKAVKLADGVDVITPRAAR